jgi:hypothetical protein
MSRLVDLASSGLADIILAQDATDPMLHSFVYDITAGNHVLAELSYKSDLVYSMNNSLPVYKSKPYHATGCSVLKQQQRRWPEKGTSSMIKGHNSR